MKKSKPLAILQVWGIVVSAILLPRFARSADLMHIDEIRDQVSNRLASVRSFSFDWVGASRIDAGGHNGFAPMVFGVDHPEMYEGRNFPPAERSLPVSGHLLSAGKSIIIRETEAFYSIPTDSSDSTEIISAIANGESRRFVRGISPGHDSSARIDKAPPFAYPGVHRTPFLAWLALSSDWFMQENVAVVRNEVSESGGTLIVLGEDPIPSPNGMVSAIEVWVDPLQKCLPVKARVGVTPQDGRAEMEITPQYSSDAASGVRVPSAMKLRLYQAGSMKESVEIEVKNCALNVPIGSDAFKLEFPPDIQVRNSIEISELDYIRKLNEAQ